MLEKCFVLMLIFGTVIYGNMPANVQVERSSILAEKPMLTEQNTQIKNVTLLAKEEKLHPLGVPQQPNRDIGFASVFVRLENSQAKNEIVLLKKIEICDASTGKVIMISQQPQEIRLHPLENSENAFHLKNRTGYGGQKKVKAVITYEVDSLTHTIESESVEVEIL